MEICEDVDSRTGKRILLVRTNDWEAIRYYDLFKIVKWLYDEEDRRYPKGMGSKGLLKALSDLRTENLDEVAKGYGVK
ncbi:MAG: hypothetical protein ACE5GD_00360 [Candidatus Geothermarchaeales archaeon]